MLVYYKKRSGVDMERVVLPKSVANAIEDMRKHGFTNFNIMRQAQEAVANENYLTIRRWAFDVGGDGSPDLLMQALVNEYDVISTPEDDVAELYSYYVRNGYDFTAKAIRAAFDLYGVSIKGVNS